MAACASRAPDRAPLPHLYARGAACSGAADSLMQEIPTVVVDPLPRDVPDGVRFPALTTADKAMREDWSHHQPETRMRSCGTTQADTVAGKRHLSYPCRRR